MMNENKELEEKLFKALASHLLHENYKLGLGLQEAQISNVCGRILYSSEKSFQYISEWQVKEETLFDTYRKENLEILDYFHFVSLELRKQLGQYVTPSIIVKYILSSVQYTPSERLISKRLIDPACGSGIFLVEALRVYLNALQNANIPISEWYPFVTNAFVGIDIDPKACLFTRFNLGILLAPTLLHFALSRREENFPSLPIYCADTLQLVADEINEAKLFHYDRFKVPLTCQFDFVIGNPPYHKIRTLRENLKEAFKESIYGHPNAYGLFLHVGINMLKEGGLLGFIVPRSMLSGLYFQNLRRFIENQAVLREIVHISERKKVFKDVLQGTMILSLIRKKGNQGKVHISCVHSTANLANDNVPRIAIDEDRVIQHLNGTSVWFVANSTTTYDIIERIIRNHPLLSGPKVNCPAKTGQIVWNRVKPFLCHRRSEKVLLLVWATDVSAFSFTFNKAGTSRPPFLKITHKTENLIVRGLSILVQRVTADEQPRRIVACIPEAFCLKHSTGYFVENHLNFIQPASDQPSVDLFFILGILNSQVVEFFFRTMSGNTQVSATELNLLPIPLGKEETAIARIARDIHTTKKTTERESLLKSLNAKVAKAYGLSKEDLEYIETYLDAKLSRNLSHR